MLIGQERVDLHIHTNASDGLLPPGEVVRLALERGLAAIAITDHDTTAGVPEAQAAALGTGLEIVPGVELSSEGEWGDIHILGLYVDLQNGLLQERLAQLRAGRTARAKGMLERLAALGMPLEWEQIAALAGDAAIGRLHIARALVQQGYVADIGEAFQRYIGWGGPAYIPRVPLPPGEAIRLIRQAGGVAILAHPAASRVTSYIPMLVSLGLQGVEVYYPEHSPEDEKALLTLARRYRLLVTGGSDFHGIERAGASLGNSGVPLRLLQRIRQAAGRKALSQVADAQIAAHRRLASVSE